MKLLSEQGQASRQYEDALSRQDRTKVQVFSAQVARSKAELALIEFQLDQSAMKAPFDAIVVSGDQSQRIGASVRQGDVLFELAPNNRYRLDLFVDEFRINDIQVGQQGHLLLAALPEQNFNFEIVRVTPVSEQRSGATVYRVEAKMLSDISALRPGLEGVGKVAVDRRLLIDIWTRGLRDWLTLQWWRLWG
jgi:multidrug efflux pump subunit AcrA (membrane-fusion protein)